MKIPEDKKLDILMAQLQERYEALHKMRDRSMQFVLWIIGFGLGMAWLLIHESPLSTLQKYAVAFLIIIIGSISIIFVHGIARGFRNNRNILIEIESMLGLYEPGFYGPNGAVLPKSFAKNKSRCTDHFNTLYLLMVVVFILLIVLTFMNPCESKPGGNTNPVTYVRTNNG